MDDIPARLAAIIGPLDGDATIPDDVQMLAQVAARQTDIHVSMQHAGTVLVALEDAAKAQERAAKTLRAALLSALQDSGAPGLVLAHHRISWTEGRSMAEITDVREIPSQLMTSPEPAPDRAAILRLLKAGEHVPGAQIGRSAPSLSVTVRK